MQRIEVALIRILNNLGDLLVFVAAFLIGVYGRYRSPFAHESLLTLYSWRELALFFIGFYTFNLLSLTVNRAYPTSRLRDYEEMARCYLKSVLMAMFWLITLGFFLDSIHISRILLLISTLTAFLGLLMKESLIRRFVSRLRGSGKNQRFVLAVSSDDESFKHILDQIHTFPLMGLKVVGVLTLRSDSRAHIHSVPNLGRLDQLSGLVEEHVIDCVVFPERMEGQDEEIKDAIWECEQRGLEAWLTLDYSDTKIRTVGLERLENISFLSIKIGPKDHYGLILKYALDRVMSFILLILFLPLMIMIVIAIKTTSPGPAIFKQHRAGVNGRKFIFYKFRSMVTNAEEMKESLRHRNEMSGPVFKILNDPRITKVGKFLRKSSLDELPQLWNVLKGDMSLVGPRPLVMPEAAQIRGSARRRLSMRPGITCYWQVGARNKIQDFSEWTALDLRYIDNWSLWLDLKILLQTIPAVLKGTGM